MTSRGAEPHAIIMIAREDPNMRVSEYISKDITEERLYVLRALLLSANDTEAWSFL